MPEIFRLQIVGQIKCLKRPIINEYNGILVNESEITNRVVDTEYIVIGGKNLPIYVSIGRVKKIVVIAEGFCVNAVSDFLISIANNFVDSPKLYVIGSPKQCLIISDRLEKFELDVSYFTIHEVDGLLPYISVRSILDLINSDESSKDNHLCPEYIEMVASEHRLWSDVVFRLIFGYFTVFGFLLFQSLEDVLQNTTRSPYYLAGYASTSIIFTLISSLYFFYLVRSQAFIAKFLDNRFSHYGYHLFKMDKLVSGSLSSKITRLVSIVVYVIPNIIIISSMIGILEYYEYGEIFEKENYFILSWCAVNIALFIIGLYTLMLVGVRTREMNLDSLMYKKMSRSDIIAYHKFISTLSFKSN
ncbi:MAG: hypothetical protein ACE37J_08005 [Pikeienuella sp.]|uniref:hypothetical protein n=1 Tax=Pikeienuella sp. TaxID=2831957 RepID=UPI00391CA9A3